MAKANKTFWIGALIGGVLGSVSALLLAPKSGRELRHDIAEGAQQVSEKTQQLAKQFGEQSGELLTTAKEKVVAMKQEWNEWRQNGAEEEEKVIVTAVADHTWNEAEDIVDPGEEFESQAETENKSAHQS